MGVSDTPFASGAWPAPVTRGSADERDRARRTVADQAVRLAAGQEAEAARTVLGALGLLEVSA